MSRATRELQERLDRGGRITTHERQVLMGEWAAKLERYKECCRLLGTLPPSRSECDRWMALGPPAGFIVPEHGATIGGGTPQKDLLQLTSYPRGNARSVTT